MTRNEVKYEFNMNSCYSRYIFPPQKTVSRSAIPFSPWFAISLHRRKTEARINRNCHLTVQRTPHSAVLSRIPVANTKPK